MADTRRRGTGRWTRPLRARDWGEEGKNHPSLTLRVQDKEQVRDAPQDGRWCPILLTRAHRAGDSPHGADDAQQQGARKVRKGRPKGLPIFVGLVKKRHPGLQGDGGLVGDGPSDALRPGDCRKKRWPRIPGKVADTGACAAGPAAVKAGRPGGRTSPLPHTAGSGSRHDPLPDLAPDDGTAECRHPDGSGRQPYPP